MKSKKQSFFYFLLLYVLISLTFMPGCGTTSADSSSRTENRLQTASNTVSQNNTNAESTENANADAKDSSAKSTSESARQSTAASNGNSGQVSSNVPAAPVSLDQIPSFSGVPSVEINGNMPFFDGSEDTSRAFEQYSALDALSRCGVAYANIGTELMPTEPRGKIGMIKPSGWHTVKYAGIDGNYLYNRCHLIGFQLAGENANPNNLITGTRYMNTEGMLPYENMVADYVKRSGNHVLYRVTPIFSGDNLLADGVLMEAKSVEDNDLIFCIFCYNVQPQITINYADGTSQGPEFTGSNQKGSANPSSDRASGISYVINTNSNKFHLGSCPSVNSMKEKNKKVTTESREMLISQGYEPCKQCNP